MSQKSSRYIRTYKESLFRYIMDFRCTKMDLIVILQASKTLYNVTYN